MAAQRWAALFCSGDFILLFTPPMSAALNTYYLTQKNSLGIPDLRNSGLGITARVPFLLCLILLIS